MVWDISAPATGEQWSRLRHEVFGPAPSTRSAALVALVQSMMARAPQYRPTAPQLVHALGTVRAVLLPPDAAAFDLGKHVRAVTPSTHSVA